VGIKELHIAELAGGQVQCGRQKTRQDVLVARIVKQSLENKIK
jgi:hypothetical protein